MLDDLVSRRAVSHFAAECRQPQGVQVSADVSSLQPHRLSPTLETAIFRIIQESVTNAIQHGTPKSVQVRLWHEQQNICVEVTDDGCGFDVERTMNLHRTGDRVPFGLSSIRERAELLGGWVEIRSHRGAGTSIRVCVPWTDQGAACQ